MNKAILIIDMPKNCWECPFSENWEVIPSIEEYHCILTNIYVNKFDKPKWCPLKSAPHKKVEGGIWTMGGYITDEFSNGWNACIEEILGE